MSLKKNTVSLILVSPFVAGLLLIIFGVKHSTVPPPPPVVASDLTRCVPAGDYTHPSLALHTGIRYPDGVVYQCTEYGLMVLEDPLDHSALHWAGFHEAPKPTVTAKPAPPKEPSDVQCGTDGKTPCVIATDAFGTMPATHGCGVVTGDNRNLHISAGGSIRFMDGVQFQCSADDILTIHVDDTAPPPSAPGLIIAPSTEKDYR